MAGAGDGAKSAKIVAVSSERRAIAGGVAYPSITASAPASPTGTAFGYQPATVSTSDAQSSRLSPVATSISPTTVDRKSVVSGQRVSVRVDLGGRRILKKKKQQTR